VCAAENALDASSSAAFADQGEIAGLGFAETFAIEQERSARDEVRLADEVLPSPG
jgi:hypothetical protein